MPSRDPRQPGPGRIPRPTPPPPPGTPPAAADAAPPRFGGHAPHPAAPLPGRAGPPPAPPGPGRPLSGPSHPVPPPPMPAAGPHPTTPGGPRPPTLPQPPRPGGAGPIPDAPAEPTATIAIGGPAPAPERRRRFGRKGSPTELPGSAATTTDSAGGDRRRGPLAFFRTRRGTLLRWTALCLGLILIGWSVGYLVMPRSGGGDQIVIPKEAFEATATRGDMPSLVGLNRDAAVAAIGDAGVSGITIDYRDKPAAGPTGTVIAQTPAAGVAVTDGIELTLSVPAPMPALKGVPNRDARTTLEDLGAIVTVESVVDPAAPAGTVLRTDPAEGQPMPSSVTMVVADPGDALSLSTVSTVSSSSCSTSSSASVAGKTLSNNVTCTPGSSKKAEAEYAINRNATLLEATVGTDDTKGKGGATVTIYGDDRPLKTVNVGLGRSEDIRVDVRNMMRLRIVVTSGGGDDSPTVVLGDARLRGSTDGLDQIAGRR